MLQQTQVARVIPVYRAFIDHFPTFQALADASPADVITAWRGMGYNSRAIRLFALPTTSPFRRSNRSFFTGSEEVVGQF